MDIYRLLDLYKAAMDGRRPFEQFIAERVMESQKEIMGLLHMPVPRSEK